MIGQVSEGLYRLDKDGNPELAMSKEDPKVSEDGLTYTFKLREAKYSDGTPVRAQDFVMHSKMWSIQKQPLVQVIVWISLKMVKKFVMVNYLLTN